MGFVIGLIVGLALGAAIAYFLTSKKTTAQSATVQDLQRQLALAESEHDRRLREATDQLRQDYAAQAQRATVPGASAGPPASPPTARPANATAPDATPARVPPVPSPQPDPQPPAPVISEPPVTATTPAPTPQTVMQSPTVPDQPHRQPDKALATSVRIDDPNAVLAASYSPDAETRRQVAQAIGQILPTAGAQAQARWFPVLGRLARDAEPSVRLAAIQALPHIKSSKRLPLLQRALKDTHPAVVAAANAILGQTKGRTKSSPSAAKRRLPKNK